MWSSITRNSSSASCQEPPVDGMEVRAGAERVTQLVGCRAQTPTGQPRERRRIRFSIRERLQHAPSTGAEQIRHEARHLNVRLLEQALQAVLKLHPVARDLVLPAHHGPPEPLLRVGHKAQRQLLRHQPLHQPFGIREISLPSRGPRFDCACARCNVPDIGPAPSRRRRRGCQYRSSASHTGRQYCAVDSITTSSTSRSASQSASARSCVGARAHLPAFKRVLAVDLRRQPRRRPASSCAHRFPRSDTTSAVSWRERRTCPCCLIQGRGLSPRHQGTTRRPIIRSNTHAPDHPIERLRLLHWYGRSRRSRRGHSRKRATDFHDLSRASKPADSVDHSLTASARAASALLAS